MALVAAAWSVAGSLPALEAGWHGGVTPFLDAMEGAAARPLPRILLAPFRALVRPLAAHSFDDWLHAIGPALLLLTLHCVWVIRADSAFEEAAAEASLRRARLRAERGGRGSPRLAYRRLPRLLRLAPTGRPGTALSSGRICVGVVRTRRSRSVAGVLIAVAAGAAVLSLNGYLGFADVVGWLAMTWAGLALLIGPQWVRNDLRTDLRQLDLLRSYPLRGHAVVAAEAAASTLVLTALQVALLVIAYVAFLRNQTMEPDLQTRTVLLLASPFCLAGVNYLGMLIQNAAALTFPAWVRLGTERPGGVEVLGQNMLMLAAYSAALATLLAVPGLLALALFQVAGGGLGWWVAVPAAVVLLAGVGGEAMLVLRWLGRVFEATDRPGAGIAA